MAVVEPMENSVTQSTSEGATMQGGKFKDRNLERLYKLFKLEYHKPAFFIFIIQMIWLNIGCIITSCVKYSYDVLPHIIAMVVFAVINVTLIGIFHKFRTFYRPLWISIIVLFSYSQVGVDIALSSYVLSPVTSFPWLLVVMVTLYKTLPLSAFMCGVLNGLAFLTHSLLVTLLPATEFGGVGFAIPNAIGSNALLVLCVNILGILWSLRNDQRLRKAFANSRSALSVNLLIEESTKEQERLLLSVLPKHVASEMLKDWGMEVGGQFRKIYMNRHEDVSILFADIVGFTAMSSMVTPAQLVQILNDLFANFDKLAEKFHQLRIKILGDCYYSISGCPEPRPDHAVLCIHMGLAMVTAIGEVREKTKSGVSMRVGIHTGAVLAGVLGQHRWQYDVLGKEVTFANKMESGGLPGRVHISETTASFLSGEFELEPGDGESREEAIRLAAVKTFLVKSITKPYPQGTLDDTNEKPNGYTRAENSIAQKEDGTIGKNRTKSFSKTAEPRNAMTLRFSDRDLEKTYSRSLSNDLDLALSLTGPVIVVVTSLLAQICVLPFTLSCLLTFLVPFLITGLTAVIPLALRYPKRFPKIIRKLSESAATKPTRRHVVVLVLVVAMVTSDMADLHVCAASWQSHKVENSTESIANTTYCNFPVFFCSSFLLIFIVVHLQYQISYLSRAFVLSAVTILSCIIYNTTVQSSFNDYDVILWSFRDPGNEYISSSIYFTITLTVICVFLMISSRNCENQRRRLFIFSQQLEETHLKIDVLRDKNKALVYNILPAHVAMHFTGTKRKDEDLYSQQYSEVGVIFASCPNFNDHYTEDAINNHGVEWMRLLNEIISDYDDLLNDQRFSSIVKIKTIGPTYMAASGLNLAQPADEDAPIVERWRHLADLVEFALALKESLDRINSQSFNHFMLRIGINHGPILAGVIGARKPHYDIWGNSVNVASRMESTGKLGEIQVVEETMLILKEFGFTFTQRGLVKVKGKGDLMTYFLTGRQVPPSA